MVRYVHFASRLTGWNAIKSRVEQLGLTMTDDQVKDVYVFPGMRLLRLTIRFRTAKIKALADVRPVTIDDADSIIRAKHIHVTPAPVESQPPASVESQPPAPVESQAVVSS
jgi:homocitrate synthase